MRTKLIGIRTFEQREQAAARQTAEAKPRDFMELAKRFHAGQRVITPRRNRQPAPGERKSAQRKTQRRYNVRSTVANMTTPHVPGPPAHGAYVAHNDTLPKKDGLAIIGICG
jgi:hypothetical protein